MRVKGFLTLKQNKLNYFAQCHQNHCKPRQMGVCDKARAARQSSTSTTLFLLPARAHNSAKLTPVPPWYYITLVEACQEKTYAGLCELLRG